MNLMFVVPYGGLERKPTQHNNQLSYGKEERSWFDLGGALSMGNGHVSSNILC